MRRAAAILGPTPPFLRWAIESNCPFLRKDNRSFPESPWRQLRALKEISAAQLSGRTWNDYCFASEATSDQILGFSLKEATRVFGGVEAVQATCRTCPSNSTPNQLAGCTGILPLVDPHTPESLNKEGFVADRFCELLQAADLLMSDREWQQRCRELSRLTKPHWFGIWKGKVLRSREIHFASDCLRALQTAGKLNTAEGHALLAALDECLQRSLVIHVEFVAAGYSDGVNWALPAACGLCGCEWTWTGRTQCECCGASASYVGDRQRRVLGRRPYMDLQRILGADEAQKLWREYETQRNLETGPKL